MEEKVINREHINIKPFAKLIVGNPCYFGDKNGENFVIKICRKTPCFSYGDIRQKVLTF